MRRSQILSFAILFALSLTLPVSAPASYTAIQIPTLKWSNAGCYSSWCETGWYSSPAVADLDGDGAPEVIASAYSIVVLDGSSGALEWRMPSGHDRSEPAASNVGRNWPGIAVADLEKDGALEIITAPPCTSSNCPLLLAAQIGTAPWRLPPWPISITTPIWKSCSVPLTLALWLTIFQEQLKRASFGCRVGEISCATERTC